MKPVMLLIQDQFYGPASGAVAARSAARIWRELGCDVCVYCEAPREEWQSQGEGVRHFTRPQFRGSDHLKPGDKKAHFEQVLNESGATHAFFLGMAYTKSSFRFHACRERKMKTFALWWQQDFYCANGYGCLREGPCNRCAGGNYLPSFIHGCGPGDGMRRYARLAGHALSRIRLHNEIVQCDAVMGSCTTHMNDYRKYGIAAEKLIHCPLFWPKDRLAGLQSRRGERFVFYAQNRFEKGFHFFRPIVERCKQARFVLPFATEEDAAKIISEFQLQEFVDDGRIEVLPGMMWNSGVGKLVAESRGVVIPSIWPSTTEYVLLEAIGLSKPVIAFNLGVHIDVLRDRENAMVVPVGDVDAFAGALDELAANDELYDTISIGAKRTYEMMTDQEAIRRAFQQALKGSVSKMVSI